MMSLSFVRSFIDAIEAKDLDAATAILADDVEYDNVPMETIRGRVRYGERFDSTGAAW